MECRPPGHFGYRKPLSVDGHSPGREFRRLSSFSENEPPPGRGSCRTCSHPWKRSSGCRSRYYCEGGNLLRTCLFCSTTPDDALAASEYGIVVPAAQPATPGHILVAPRRHVAGSTIWTWRSNMGCGRLSPKFALTSSRPRTWTLRRSVSRMPTIKATPTLMSCHVGQESNYPQESNGLLTEGGPVQQRRAE